MLSTTTWHAYNDWGGPSLYTGGTRVSFERPLARGFLVKPEPIGRMMQPEPDREAMGFRRWARPLGLSDWCGGAGWFTYERTFTRWAEANGYRVDVAISQDLEQHPEILEGPRLVLGVGHDEYWSWGMRDAFDAFVGARRQRGDPVREHVLLAGEVRRRAPRDDRLQVPGRTTTRSSARRTNGS